MKLAPHLLTLTNNKGVSLVEVLVATVVLAFGLLGVAVLQYAALAGNAFSREMQVGSELAQEKVEMFKSAEYSTLVDGAESLSDQNVSRFGGMIFLRRWWVRDGCRDVAVEYEPDNPCDPGAQVQCVSPLSDVKAVTVRVCWVDKNGGNHSISLNSLKRNEAVAP